jgi:hypothetical protein
MRDSVKSVLIIAGTIVLAGAVSTPFAVAGSGSAPVVVTNPTSSPIPVAGSVNVGNLPATQAVSGTLNVGNFPSTQAVSGTVEAKPAAPSQPYAVTLEKNAPASQLNIVDGLTVPAGKTLVIEAVSALIMVPQGQQPRYLRVFCPTGGGVAANHYQQYLYQATAEGMDTFAATNENHIYCDPGSTVAVEVFRNQAAGAFSMNVTLSGYLS